MGKAIRYCKHNEAHSGPNCFDVSRPSVFGNPYTHIKNKKTKALHVVKSREEAVMLYEKYFDSMIKVNKRFKDEWDKLYNAYKEYDYIYIGCFCPLSQLCHADIIIKKLEQREIKEELSELKRENEGNGL